MIPIPKVICKSFLYISILIIGYSCSKDSENKEPEETIASNCFKIGDPFQGGIVFYIDQTNEHGLIAAEVDQSEGALWGCQESTIETAKARDIGFGQQNTISIVQNCSDLNTAAKICSELSLNGYSDWFLPSLHELEMLYHYKDLVGGFAEGSYYCSSELEYQNSYKRAATIDFTLNRANPHRMVPINKSIPARVRAIRKF